MILAILVHRGRQVQGPPGPDKELQVRTVSGDARVVSPGGTGSSTASCEPDEVATGGGFLWDGLGNIENSKIQDTLAAPNEWVATDDNPASNTAADVIEAHAVCAKLVDVP